MKSGSPAEHGSGSDESRRQSLSDLMDGHGADGLDNAIGAWREDAELRATWHAYHLVGDVLRSTDLATDLRRDEAFLRELRTRLAQEPVLLAPEPGPEAAAARRGRSRMWMPAAAAAGFVAVAGILVAMNPSGRQPRGIEIARDAASSAPVGSREQVVTVPVAVGGTGEPSPRVLTGQLIRDAQLDRYLDAHRRVSGGAGVQIPGAMIRNVNAATYEGH